MTDAFTAPLLAPAFTLAGSAVSWLELAALLLAVWMVLCNLRVNPLAWPLAMASSALYGLLFAHSRLYGEAGLQLVFIALAAWGWRQWQRGRPRQAGASQTRVADEPLRVRSLTARQRLLAAALTLAAWPLLALLLQHATNSDLPWLDALPTVGSITGQILLARKKVDNWPVWLAVNLVSVVLFSVKGLWLTAGLYALFALLSVVGWRAWLALERQGRAHG